MKQIIKEIIQLILVLIILILGMTSCSNKVIAVIDGEKIREKDVESRLNYYRQVNTSDTVVVQPWMLIK